MRIIQRYGRPWLPGKGHAITRLEALGEVAKRVYINPVLPKVHGFAEQDPGVLGTHN
jgi:hypothetical protein